MVCVIDNAVIQQSIINRLADPNRHDLRSLQNWLERPNIGNLAFIGKDRDIWGASDEPISPNIDLLVINSGGKTDLFFIWFAQKFIYWFYYIFWHRIKKPDDIESGIVLYKDTTLQKFTSHIIIIIASLLPILAIAVLYCIGAMNARLGLITLFMIVFTTCLLFFTNAIRIEIFISTLT